MWATSRSCTIVAYAQRVAHFPIRLGQQAASPLAIGLPQSAVMGNYARVVRT
jgi:hypothetical protein